jgi:hypothetical protein
MSYFVLKPTAHLKIFTQSTHIGNPLNILVDITPKEQKAIGNFLKS